MKRAKRNTSKWFGHAERMGSEEFVKVYESELKGTDRRGRPLGRGKDRVEEYLGERQNGKNRKTILYLQATDMKIEKRK